MSGAASGGRILVADGDPLQRQLVDMLFAVDGFDLDGVDSGRAALEVLKRSTPVLAILALELPDIGGAAICARMKSVARLSGVPVVLVAEASGRLGLDETTRAVARDAGAGLLLQKPLGDKNLRERALRLMRDAREASAGAAGAGAAGRGTRSARVLEETLRRMDAGTADARSDPAARRIAALEAENRSLRERIARLEAAAARANDEPDDGTGDETDEETGEDTAAARRSGGLFRRRR